MTCSFIEILLSERDEKVISHYCVALFIKVKSLSLESKRDKIEGTHRGSLVYLITSMIERSHS